MIALEAIAIENESQIAAMSEICCHRNYHTSENVSRRGWRDHYCDEVTKYDADKEEARLSDGGMVTADGGRGEKEIEIEGEGTRHGERKATHGEEHKHTVLGKVEVPWGKVSQGRHIGLGVGKGGPVAVGHIEDVLDV